MFRTCLLVLSALWIASEITLAFVRRAPAATERHDAGTLKLLNVVIYASVTCAFVLSAWRIGLVAVPPSVLWSGLALIIAGLALKWWAVFSLRQFFTVDVAIHPHHKLVRRGPYRWLRHPAYSGVLLSFVGLAVATSSWVSALAILIPITFVFLRRVHIEEQALSNAFPKEYPAYCAESSRLVPGIY